MMIEHHLDEATLVAYAGGTLDEAFLVVVASHLAMCDHCRRAVRAAEEAGGAVLECAGAEPLDASGFDRLIERIERAPAPSRSEAPAPGDIPAPLARLVGPRLADLRWRTVAPGVRKLAIPSGRGSRSSLFMLWVGPGKAMPEHGHGGNEVTLILSGAYRDELGRFGRGDIADLDENIEHTPRVDGDEPCICVVAAERPTRFKGLIGRLMQPWLGI